MKERLTTTRQQHYSPRAVLAAIGLQMRAMGILHPLQDQVHIKQKRLKGAVAIKEWSDREVIGANVTFEVTAATVGDGETIVTTKVDGDYDKINLPDPHLLDHHITVNGDKISRLLILQNQDAA